MDMATREMEMTRYTVYALRGRNNGNYGLNDNLKNEKVLGIAKTKDAAQEIADRWNAREES
jgi:hypothetical protein